MVYMQRALELARRAVAISSPNPPVGAVIVKDGEIVGEGYTLSPGKSHAEVIAIKQAGYRANGSALYTTLEPCCHFGKTPPCTGQIIDSGIKEVHIAFVDPNPLVDGKGIQELKDAGIKIYLDEYSDQVSEIIEAYVKFMQSGEPFVVAKFAMSLDGKISTRSGQSKWITSEESRHVSRTLRSIVDGVLVGIGTVLQDDPMLTVRDQGGNSVDRQPLRIILDSSARIPLSSNMLKQPGSTLIATSDPSVETESRIKNLREMGVEIVSIPGEDGLVDLVELMKILGQRGILSIMVEGGSRVLGSFFDLDLVDKIPLFSGWN